MLLYVNAACAAALILLVARCLTVRDVTGRVLEIPDAGTSRAEAMVNGLLSVDGVDEVVVVESEGVAYLKIDNTVFVEEKLERHLAQSGTAGVGRSESSP